MVFLPTKDWTWLTVLCEFIKVGNTSWLELLFGVLSFFTSMWEMVTGMEGILNQIQVLEKKMAKCLNLALKTAGFVTNFLHKHTGMCFYFS